MNDKVISSGLLSIYARQCFARMLRKIRTQMYLYSTRIKSKQEDLTKQERKSRTPKYDIMSHTKKEYIKKPLLW